VLRDADAPDGPAGPRDLERGLDDLFETHAFEHRMRPEPLGQLSNALDGFLAALARSQAAGVAKIPPGVRTERGHRRARLFDDARGDSLRSFKMTGAF
jgi:hypothetical protein